MTFDHFQYANGDVDIYRKMTVTQNGQARDRWVPWALVRESVAVRGGGKGLFAAKGFHKGDLIGRYVGHILGKPRDVETSVERLSQTLQGDAITTVNGYYVDGRRKVQENSVQERLFGRVVLSQPEWSWPGVHAHIANDAHGTRRQNNAQVTPGGYMHTTRPVPPYNFAAPHSQNAASEILWPYGTTYWSNSKKLGTASMPYIID